MIAKLKGIIDELSEHYVIVDVNGVGYLVFASANTLRKIGTKGEAVSLCIETHVREDHIHLYGFADTLEKTWFGILCSVQGVGAKVAMSILSALTPDQLSLAIVSQDKTALAKADGVGPKLASRLALELKDKVGKIDLTSGSAEFTITSDTNISAAAPVQDAVLALVSLGYKRMDAFAAVMKISKDMGEDADTSAIIRAALKK